MVDGDASGRGRREVELKYRLADAAALEKVIRAAGGRPGAGVRQVDTIFDTPDRDLDRAKLALRLREADGTCVVTAKGPADVAAGALTSRPEEEAAVEPDVARRILAGELSPLAPLEGGDAGRRRLVAALHRAARGKPLAAAGSGFETVRTRVPWPVEVGGRSFDAALEVDETRFPCGVVHHEIELEVPEGLAVETARERLTDLLDAAGVPFWTAPPKIQRYFAILDLERLNAELPLRENDGGRSRRYFEQRLARRFAMRRADGGVVGRRRFLAALAGGGDRRSTPIAIELLGAERALVTCVVTTGGEKEPKRFHNVRLFIRSDDAPEGWLLLAWANERIEA
jgi:uncharacterized protein YjbK